MARILVIDDDEAIRRFVYSMLKAEGHVISEACDGLAAADCYRTEHVDLVITDLEMPNRGGLEVIEELKADFPRTRIIAVTGAPEDLVERALKLGADLIFFKPFAVRAFLEAVEVLLTGPPQ